MPTPTINRDTVLPGLLIIADVVARIPERREDLIAYEIKRRERELALLRETYARLTWHPFQTAKSIILYALSGFALAWATGALASLGQSYQAVKEGHLSIPLPLLSNIPLGIGSLVPTSTALAVAARLPSFTMKDAIIIGLAAALLVLIGRIIMTLIHWKRTAALHDAAKELEKEIETLAAWRMPPAPTK